MDRELYFVPEHTCYIVRWIADITGDALLEHWRDLVERPEFDPCLVALHDFRGIEVRRGKTATIVVGEIYRRDVEPRVGFGRAAIIVDDAAKFERANHLISMLELDGTLVSYSEQEAKTWVGLPGDFALPYSGAAG